MLREGDTVIVCKCGPVDGFINARLVTVDNIGDGFMLVEGKLFPLDSPWELVDGSPVIQHVLKPDTPENRMYYGLA